MKLYPLVFTPIYKERIWGGNRLAELYGRPLPKGQKIGESWELVDLTAPDISLIAKGPLAGKSIHDLVVEKQQELFGQQARFRQFPLLIKILDCQDILSVQVHPDAEACQRLGKGSPKTEAWYILEAEDSSFIYKGLKPGVTKEEFCKALKEGGLADLLRKVPVKKGECHFIPAGTVHALGAGIVVAEIQTPSDTTYRVFDWERLDEKGRPRQLHIQEALESINFKLQDWPVTSGSQLVESEFFNIKKITLLAKEKIKLISDTVKVLIVTEGEALLENPCQSLVLKAASPVLIPSQVEVELMTQRLATILIVTL